MILKQTVAATASVVSVDELGDHLRLTAEGSPGEYAEQTLLQMKIDAAIATIDGADGWLNRALVTQTWRMSFELFGSRLIRLPLPPLQSVTSLKYLDPDGVEQTFAASNYRVITDATPGLIYLNDDSVWPSIARAPDAVRITFVAGYGEAAAVPSAIRNAVLIMAGTLYEQREELAFGVQPFEIPGTVKSLLSTYRFHGLV